MQTEEQLKEIVRKKYSEIALQDKETNMSSCCGAGGEITTTEILVPEVVPVEETTEEEVKDEA